LEVTANNALGSTDGNTTVASGAALKLNNVIYTTAEGLTINGTGVSNGGALVNAGNSTFGGAITLGANSTISAGGGNLTLTGGIEKDNVTLTLTGGGNITVSGTGISGNTTGTSDLVVDGTRLNLNIQSTFSGPTTVQNGGTISFGVADALLTGTDLTLLGGSTLTFGGAYSQTNLGKLMVGTGNGTIDFGNSAVTLVFGDSSGMMWSGYLYLVNFTPGVDHLFFGGAGLSDTNPPPGGQLGLIKFTDPSDFAVINGGEISAVPEPSTYAALLGAAALLLAVYRRRFCRR
jgi:hypothetical protein